MKDKISELFNQIEETKKEFLAQFEGLPQNDNIVQLRDQSFVLWSSDLSMQSWSPKFYNYKCQYDIIVEKLKGVRSENFFKVFEQIKKEGRIQVKPGYTEQINPKVIEHLNSLEY